jgi:hypothetical protein
MTRALVLSVLILTGITARQTSAQIKTGGQAGPKNIAGSASNTTDEKGELQATGKAGESNRSLVRIVAGYSDDSLSFDPLVVYDEPKASPSFDGMFDALKMFNTDAAVTNFYSFSSSGRELSINGMAIDSTAFSIRLGLKTDRDGTVIFKIKNISGGMTGWLLSLEDMEAGTFTSLNDGSYQIFLPAGVYEERFFLNFSLPLILTDVPSEPARPQDLFSIYPVHGVLRARFETITGKNGELFIHDLKGCLINHRMITYPGSYDIPVTLPDGIYLATFVTGNIRVSRKVMIIN